MTSIESVLKIYGNGIEADDFADQLGHLMRRRVTVDPRALSDHDRRVLAGVGVPAADLDRQQSGGLVVASMEVGDSRGAVDRRQALQCGVRSMVVVPVQEAG